MKNKYIIGGVIIVIFFGLMGYLFTQTNISYENNFSQVMNTSKTIKATGSMVKSQNYQYDKKNRILKFWLKDDEGVVMKVVYKGSIPNNFESASTLVVTGKYVNGYFHASDILTKCPSKYQEQYKESSNS
ncbi:cytochrome c-type biogenesis protein CcmE [bacterium BMS3Abin04]|nr:cytochrome c-type biogenesis protein CcmE [bacterium BMS3Abin04]